MLLLILQVPLEQELHLLGWQLQMCSSFKQGLNALLLPQPDLLQQTWLPHQHTAACTALFLSKTHSMIANTNQIRDCSIEISNTW